MAKFRFGTLLCPSIFMGKAMRQLIFSVVIAVSTISFADIKNALAQSLPSDAVSAFMQRFSDADCLTIPTGRQSWNIDFRTNGISETSQYNNGRTAFAFQKM